MVDHGWQRLVRTAERASPQHFIKAHRNFSDRIRFAGVCTPWRLVAFEKPTHKHLPWLLLDCEKKDKDKEGCCLFNASCNKLHYFNRSLDNHLFKDEQGWQLFIKKSMDDEHYLIPYISQQLQGKLDLPPFPHYSSKIVLPSNPTSTNCDAMVLFENQYGKAIGFAKPGDPFWTVLYMQNLGYSSDFAYWNGQFYIVNDVGTVAIHEPGYPCPIVKPINSPPINNRGWRFHLVESSYGELLLVNWFRTFFSSKPGSIELFKLDGSTQQWLRMESIGDQTLFLSSRSSFSLLSSDYPGLEANSVYYISNWYGSTDFCGIYNLESGIFKPFSTACNQNDNMHAHWPSGMWFRPSLW